MLGIGEGSLLELRVEGDRIMFEHFPDAVELSLHGEKVVKINLEELKALKR